MVSRIDVDASGLHVDLQLIEQYTTGSEGLAAHWNEFCKLLNDYDVFLLNITKVLYQTHIISNKYLSLLVLGSQIGYRTFELSTKTAIAHIGIT